MAMKFDREPYEAMSIDMTPMVDAIFALVLFILVAADFQDSLEQDLTIQLPTKGKVTEPVAGKPERITVNVRHIGSGQAQLIVGGQQYTKNQLIAHLSKAYVTNNEQEVVVRGDKHVAWDHVADVMHACSQARIKHFSATVATQEE